MVKLDTAEQQVSIARHFRLRGCDVSHNSGVCEHCQHAVCNKCVNFCCFCPSIGNARKKSLLVRAAQGLGQYLTY
jgi:hypothetical protein